MAFLFYHVHLGVIVECSILLKAHVDKITLTDSFHLRNIAEVRNMMSLHDAEKLIHAYDTCRLD